MDISSARLASHPVRPPNSRPARVRRVTRSILALAALAIIVGLVLAPAATASPGDFVISGRGNGHGVGMSQWGAWQGARSGKTHAEILAFYYPGTTLESLNDPGRLITIRLTYDANSSNYYYSVSLRPTVTTATLVTHDVEGDHTQTLAVGEVVATTFSAGKVQVAGITGSFDWVEVRPDSTDGRVVATRKATSGSTAVDREYWGTLRVEPNTSTNPLRLLNIVLLDRYIRAVTCSEIDPSWASSGDSRTYAPEAVKAQSVAARSYAVSSTGVITDSSATAQAYGGYTVEARYPSASALADSTAGMVLTYGGAPIRAFFSSSNGGHSALWTIPSSYPYLVLQPDPWSLVGPPSWWNSHGPGYAWSYTISPANLTSALSLGIGTITQVDITVRDTEDPTSHARSVRVTGTSGTKTISADTFKSGVNNYVSGVLKQSPPMHSRLILSVLKEGGVPRYQQTDSRLAFAGSWSTFSTSGASGGSYKRTSSNDASVTVEFTGTYLAWIATKGTTLGKAFVKLDNEPAVSVDLAASAVAYQQKVWETGILESGAHKVKIWRDPSSASGKYVSVDAFDVIGDLVQAVAEPSLQHYEQTHSYLGYIGTWEKSTVASASGGDFAYLNSSGSVTVKFTGTHLAWMAKKSPVYGKAKVTLDSNDPVTVDLYSPSTLYKQSVWNTGTLDTGTHTLTIEWTGTRNPSASASNISVDAFDVVGSLVQAPKPARYEQTDTHLVFAGSWSTFSTTGASGGSYKRASTSGASVTITFEGTYLAWIATKGTTLGKALVSLDGGTAAQVNLAASAVSYQQNVWTTGLLTQGVHTVKIWRDPSSAAGKYISVDAIELIGSLN